MEQATAGLTCVHCGKNESAVPIVRLRFRGSEVPLCSSCLPILLHRPEKLAGKLEGAETIPPASHGHD